jgi:hypothetical protein
LQRPPLWVPGEGLAQPVGGELDVFALAVCLEPQGRKKVATYYFCGFARLCAAAGPTFELARLPEVVGDVAGAPERAPISGYDIPCYNISTNGPPRTAER